MAKSMKKAMKAMKAKKTAKKGMKKAKKTSAKKGMKKKKAKRVSKITKKKWMVFAGRKEKTQSGLKKTDLLKSKTGRVVSKKKSLLSKQRYAAKDSKVKLWINAVMKARKTMNLKGFQTIGGKSAKGQELLKRARSIYAKK